MSSENQGRRYPILYLNDGQNLFEPSTAFAGVDWQVDDTADRLIRDGVVPPMIIVGIDHAGKDRIREFMPHRSLHPVMLRVQGMRYPDFLTKEVMPFIARNYRAGHGTGEYRPRRLVVRRVDRALHCSRAAWIDWTIAARESFALGFEPADSQGESSREALAGACFSCDGHCGSREERQKSECRRRCARAGWNFAPRWIKREASASGD